LYPFLLEILVLPWAATLVYRKTRHKTKPLGRGWTGRLDYYAFRGTLSLGKVPLRGAKPPPASGHY